MSKTHRPVWGLLMDAAIIIYCLVLILTNDGARYAAAGLLIIEMCLKAWQRYRAERVDA